MTGNFDKPLTERMHPDGSVVSLRAYELAGGYQAIRKVFFYLLNHLDYREQPER